MEMVKVMEILDLLLQVHGKELLGNGEKRILIQDTSPIKMDLMELGAIRELFQAFMEDQVLVMINSFTPC